MGFLDELNSNAKNRVEFEKEELNQKNIKERMQRIELENAEKMRINEFKKSLARFSVQFIKIIKDACFKASQQGVFYEKNDKKIINGEIIIYGSSYSGSAVECTCQAKSLKKRHLFKEDEYNWVYEDCRLTDSVLRDFADNIYKYQEVFIDFIKEQIPEISFEKRSYDLANNVFPFKIIF